MNDPLIIQRLIDCMTDATERRWSPEFVAHYNRHEAFVTRETIDGNKVAIHHNDDFDGPVFAIELNGRYYVSGKFYPLPR